MIIKKYQQPMVNYIGRMVGERELALDFTQEVFIKAFSSLRSYKSQYKFSTWLFKIASNTVIDFWRKKKLLTFSIDQTREDSDDDLPFQIPDDKPSTMRKLELRELREKIDRALRRLPPHLRELFVWRHVNGLSYEEMAEIKDLPVGTVKNRVFQAKEVLRVLLEENP
jgi:RNA polymerase sigma-70 factor (ECF subfamily)